MLYSIIYYYLFYLLADLVPFLGLYGPIPSIYRKNPKGKNLSISF